MLRVYIVWHTVTSICELRVHLVLIFKCQVLSQVILVIHEDLLPNSHLACVPDELEQVIETPTHSHSAFLTHHPGQTFILIQLAQYLLSQTHIHIVWVDFQHHNLDLFLVNDLLNVTLSGLRVA